MSNSKKIKTEEEKVEIENYLRDGTIPENKKDYKKRNFVKKCEGFLLREGDLFIEKNKHLVPFYCEFQKEKIKAVIENAHLPGHICPSKLEDILLRKVGGITRQDIRDYVQRCDKCQHNQPLVTRPPSKNIIENGKMHRWIADSVDMSFYASLNDGYCWILNIIDSYSKFVWSFALKDKTMATYVKVFRKLFQTEGPPRKLHTDNGTEFKNSFLNELCAQFNVKRRFGRARHPQSQGQIERFNGTLKNRLRKALDGDGRWIDMLDEVVYQYNCTKHRAIDKVPFKVHRGISGVLEDCFDEDSVDLNSDEVVDESFRNNYINVMNRNADSNYNKQNIKVGDQVLLKQEFDTHPKTKKRPLDELYSRDIYTVIWMEFRTLKIRFNGDEKQVDISRVKKYFK